MKTLEHYTSHGQIPPSTTESGSLWQKKHKEKDPGKVVKGE